MSFFVWMTPSFIKSEPFLQLCSFHVHAFQPWYWLSSAWHKASNMKSLPRKGDWRLCCWRRPQKVDENERLRPIESCLEARSPLIYVGPLLWCCFTPLHKADSGNVHERWVMLQAGHKAWRHMLLILMRYTRKFTADLLCWSTDEKLNKMHKATRLNFLYMIPSVKLWSSEQRSYKCLWF